jgi:hypothetical protein
VPSVGRVAFYSKESTNSARYFTVCIYKVSWRDFHGSPHFLQEGAPSHPDTMTNFGFAFDRVTGKGEPVSPNTC